MTEFDIFAPAELAGITVRNHLFRSATDEGMADENGFPTDRFMNLYRKLAEGGVGCIFSTYMGVEKGAVPMEHMVLIDTDDKVERLKELTDMVHSHGCPIICQIAHAGTHSIAGSVDIDKLSEERIHGLIQSFISAAKRSKDAGFDGVQIHCAHGYLLSETLSPYTNHRKDAWGGSEENRFRMVSEIIAGIRRELPDYPLMVKMNGSEEPKGGLDATMAAGIAKRMEDAGIDAIEVSCSIGIGLGPMHGDVPVEMMLDDLPKFSKTSKALRPIMRTLIKKSVKMQEPRRMYNIPAAKTIKGVVDIPIIAVGGIHDMSEIREAFDIHGMDFVALSRPLIAEPDLIKKYAQGTSDRSLCTDCNKCIIGVHCRPLVCYRDRN